MPRYLVEIVVECEDDKDIFYLEEILEDESSEDFRIRVEKIEEIDD